MAGELYLLRVLHVHYKAESVCFLFKVCVFPLYLGSYKDDMLHYLWGILSSIQKYYLMSQEMVFIIENGDVFSKTSKTGYLIQAGSVYACMFSQGAKHEALARNSIFIASITVQK